MKRMYYLLLLVVAAIIITAAPASRATVMVKQSVPEMAKKADNIVIGRVVSTKSEWSATGTQIFTYTTLEVSSAVKGTTKGSLITIKELGGIVGDIRQKIIGAAQYSMDEEVILFLNKADGKFRTLGMMQGKYNIVVDASTGAKQVVNKSMGNIETGVKFLKSDGSLAPAASVSELGLDEFLSIINNTLSE